MYDTTKSYKGRLLDLIRSTWETPYLVVRDLGGYAAINRRHDLFEPHIDHTDGIGTKGRHHWQKRTFAHAVTDAMAMNLNDLATVDATPYKLQCHVIMPHDDDVALFAIMEEMTRQCRSMNIAITGGETSIQNNMDGMDISITMSGFFENKPRFGVQCMEGDWLLAVNSDGLHSNGYTLASPLLKDEWADELTRPTRVYHEFMHKVFSEFEVRGAWHIAGGGLSRLKTPGLDMRVVIPYYRIPQVFNHLYQLTKDDEMMYKTFNCGVGFVISVTEEVARGILHKYDEFRHIGQAVAGTGMVHIVSSFIGKEITL